MKLISKYIKDFKEKTTTLKMVTGFNITFLLIIAFNLTSFAFEPPNKKKEIEPNNTLETAQLTQPTNEIAERFAADDWSGRYSVTGKATSLDDDWYKVSLSTGVQYLSILHAYGDNATYVELLDSEKNVVIPKNYGTRYNITKFDSKGGTYYIHIIGASEKENQYTVYVGTPTLSSEEVYVQFDPVRTTGTIKKTFSLVGEDVLPEQALVSKITLRDLPALGYSGARVTSSSSPTSITYKMDSLSGNIGSLGMELKSTWNVEFYPRTTVTSVPIVDLFYFYPVYDNTVYPHRPTIKK